MGDTMTVTRSIREHLPAPLARTAGAVRRRLRGLAVLVRATAGVPAGGDDPVRMLVGPTNSAGQGYAWAQAAKTLPGVDAVSFSLHRKGQFQFAERLRRTARVVRPAALAARTGAARPRRRTRTSWSSRCARSSAPAATRTRPPTSPRCCEPGINVVPALPRLRHPPAQPAREARALVAVHPGRRTDRAAGEAGPPARRAGREPRPAGLRVHGRPAGRRTGRAVVAGRDRSGAVAAGGSPVVLRRAARSSSRSVERAAQGHRARSTRS